MRKQILTALCIACSVMTVSAQTLFTLGNDTVTVGEFVKAYKKNNIPGRTATPVQEYLDLYIASRLKIKEAKARGYDTLPQLQADIENLRAQILPSYLNDKDAIEKLVNEAFSRSQKDIKLSHIFIGFSGNDTTAAFHKATQAYKSLQSGQPFAQVARQFSDDASAKDNGGNLGYITVFTLPYELENLAYSTQTGKYSAIYKSKAGYHIFKNEGERKAAGRMKVAQILISYPPESDAASKNAAKKLADSLYNRLLKGDDFGKLATQFSNDMISAASNGQLPEFGVGQYDPAFESAAFALLKDGAISKPFLTQHGWHIIKRISHVPVKTDKNSAAVRDELLERVQTGDRMNSIHAAMAKKILARFQKSITTYEELWAYSDSVLDQKPLPVKTNLAPHSALFNIGMHAVTAADWIMYAQMNRYRNNGAGVKNYNQLWEEFLTASALDYYKKNLEQFSPEFKAQIDEFKDGNLFFEIMQKEVWEPAQTDTAALSAYYQHNKLKYTWKESADAVVFYANDIPTAKLFEQELTKTPLKWREIVSNFEQEVVADSGRYEFSTIPGITKAMWKPGALTPLTINKEDNTATVTYIIKVYTQPTQRTFAEAKGLVINDYQEELERKWLEGLRKKYPVTVNQNALRSLKL